MHTTHEGPALVNGAGALKHEAEFVLSTVAEAREHEVQKLGRSGPCLYNRRHDDVDGAEVGDGG